MKITSIWGEQTNPFYSPETANNGGGYFQPEGGAIVRLSTGQAVTVYYSDTSCGDFGTRRSWAVYAPLYGWQWCEDTMDLDYDEICERYDRNAEMLDHMARVLRVPDAEIRDMLADVQLGVDWAAR